MDPNRLRRLSALPFLVAVLLALGACSSGGDDVGTTSAGEAAPASAGDGGAADADAPTASRRGAFDSSATDSLLAESANGTLDFAAAAAPEEAPPDADETGERAIISKGVVSLRDDDVAQARFDVQKIVDGHDGEVAEEKTETDDDGDVSRSRLVVRVPASDFDATMEALEEVSELESSSRNSEDVTTTVIDNAVRIRAQTESLRRIEVLLARAQSIRDIVNIESQLTRRQADLDSLKSQQAYLADQTSMSTITVFLEQKPAPATKKAASHAEATGFLAGLGSGWEALKAFTTGAATVVGTLLPFAVLFLVLGIPAWLLFRSLGRRPRPVAQTEAGSNA